MKIEAVVISVGYGDFLAWTLPTNKSLFDNMVVVTTPEDKHTQRICEYWNVNCIQTDVFYEDGAKINKGSGINQGLKVLKGDGFIVHMDADIFLPPLFREIVNSLPLKDDVLYHIDRMMCVGGAAWIDFINYPTLQHEDNIYVHMNAFPMGVRLSKKEYQGWTPIGFFQMWNQGKMRLSYPNMHGNAGRSDILFTIDNFPRDKRELLPEIVAIHLETKLEEGEHKMGANWEGRRTPQFMSGVYPTPQKMNFKSQEGGCYDEK